MKGQRMKRYFIQVDTSSDYLSGTIQITAKDFWCEFENCKRTMNDHNEHLDEEEKEYNSYEIDKKVEKLAHSTSTEYAFYLGGTNVYLTEIKCDEGYCFKKKGAK